MQIISQQIVASDSGAVRPEQNPVQAGYTFTGYQQPYTDAQQDLTRTTQYDQISSSNKSQYFAEHTYSVGSYKMRASDNLSAVQVIGDMSGNGMTSQLTSVTFQQNLFQIMPSCFINCEKLQTVNITGQTKWIGDYAFCGCRNLRHVNALTYPKQTQINVIGAHAFHGTALTDIAIDLTASYYDTGIGEYAFADCTSLKSVRLTNSAYLGYAAFQGCTALTSVILPNNSSYAYPETFSGCTSLQRIDIPPKVWMLNDGMFRNCTSLTAVELQDYVNNRSVLDRLGSDVFDGCSVLSSIVIPPSISSLIQIDENFLRGSSIRKITFSGLPDDIFTSGHTENSFSTVNGYVTQLDPAKKVIEDALDRNIPMVLVTCKKSIQEDITSDCGICRALARMLNDKAWLNYMDSNKDKCYFIEASYKDNIDLWRLISYPSRSKDNPLNGIYNKDSGTYAKLLVIYKNPNGKVSSTAWSGTGYVNKLIAQVDKIVSKSNEKVIESASRSATVSKFGSPFDYVLAYSSTGTEYKLSSNSTVEKYIAPEVDTVTTSDFKTGVWYYNAKELKQYADNYGIPVFVEFSDYGCTPCTKFRTEIYERQEFQEWVAKQPYLFCRIETKNFGEFNRMATQPYFAKQVWAKGGTVGLPCFIFYWNRQQDPVWDMFGYHDNQIGYQELIDMISQKFKQQG